jgi:type II secretory pathway component PulJ
MSSHALKTTPKHRPEGQKGFTLVDILVGLSMASILLAAVVSLFTSMGRSYTIQNVAADVQQVTRAGVEVMIQEIRMAGFNPIGSSATGIVDNFDKANGFHELHDGRIAATDAQNFAFTLDADMDGRIDHCIDDGPAECPVADDNIENELIAYRINDGALEKYRSASAKWEDLTEDNVSDLNFTYYDGNGGVTTDVGAIRSVEISMTIRQPAGWGRMISRTYKTRVRCRNIGL